MQVYTWYDRHVSYKHIITLACMLGYVYNACIAYMLYTHTYTVFTWLNVAVFITLVQKIDAATI